MQLNMNLDKMENFIKRLKNQEHLLLLTLGDSLTCNAHYTKGFKAWPELLHTELRRYYDTQRILLINSGVCGDTTLNVLDRFDKNVKRFKPDMTTLCLGMNDALKLSESDFEKNMISIVDMLYELGSDVFLRTPNPIMEVKNGECRIWQGAEKLMKKVEITREIAFKKEVPFIDVYTMWEMFEREGTLNLKEIMYDEVHPNEKGHAFIFRNISKAFSLPATFFWEREN